MVYKFQCGLYNEFYYSECVRNHAVRSSGNISFSHLTLIRLGFLRLGLDYLELVESKKNCWHHFLYTVVISMFVERKCQKIQKVMKIVDIDRGNIPIF